VTGDRPPHIGPPDRTRLTEHDRRRLRATWWTLGTGVVAGALGAVGIAVIGGSGAAGLAVLLLLTAAGSVVAALVTALLAILDEYRRVAVGRPRAYVALGLFVTAGVLVIMSVGAAGA
jgi:hypothetical protein